LDIDDRTRGDAGWEKNRRELDLELVLAYVTGELKLERKRSLPGAYLL
jgi:hypothetical protein